MNPPPTKTHIDGLHFLWHSISCSTSWNESPLTRHGNSLYIDRVSWSVSWSVFQWTAYLSAYWERCRTCTLYSLSFWHILFCSILIIFDALCCLTRCSFDILFIRIFSGLQQTLDKFILSVVAVSPSNWNSLRANIEKTILGLRLEN